MSADFWSFVLALPLDEARALERSFARGETRSPIFDPNGAVLHDPRTAGNPVDFGAIAKASGGRAPELLGASYVVTNLDALAPILDNDMSMTSGYPAIVVVDRALALPHGIDLMGGAAVRVLTADELMAVSDALSAVAGALGPAATVAKLAPYLDKSGMGTEDAQEIWSMLDRAITETFKAWSALFMLGVAVPAE